MLLQVGVKILLKNAAGKYLLLRRNPEKYPDMWSSWDIVGGRIEPGSPLVENLRREIREETRLDYAGTPKLVAAQDILRPDKHVVRLTFTGELQGEPVIDSDHLEARWLTASEIRSLGTEVDEFLRELIDTGIIRLE